MPATYAHYSFGEDCYQLLPDNLKKIVKDNRSLFDLGVHGPDILFYDLIKKEVEEVGYHMHAEPGKKFFTNAKEVLNNSKENYEKRLSYVLGFLTHFTFDCSAHSYVERKRTFNNITHNKVEAEYERYLIEKDGFNPIKFDRSKLICHNKETYEILEPFLPATSKQIKRSLKMQSLLLNLMDKKSLTDRRLKTKIFYKLGLIKEANLILDEKPYELCQDSNLRLEKCRELGRQDFPKLLKNFMNFLENKEELNKYFDHDFGAWENYEIIPVLTLEEEKEYKLEPHKI